VLVHIGRIKNVVAITVKVAELSRYVYIPYLSVYFVLWVSECGWCLAWDMKSYAVTLY